MSNQVVLCDGVWIVDGVTGAISCDGSVMTAEESYFYSFPSITYEQANDLLVPIGVIFATVFVYVQISRFLSDQRPD